MCFSCIRNTATLAAISNGAKRGILFKGGAYLENFSQLKAIAFDKTGTLTKGIPVVTDSFFDEQIDTQKLLNVCVALEKTSTHPLAKAIVTKFNNQTTEALEDIIIKDITGHGLECVAYNQLWRIGKKILFLMSKISIDLFYQQPKLCS